MVTLLKLWKSLFIDKVLAFFGVKQAMFASKRLLRKKILRLVAIFSVFILVCISSAIHADILNAQVVQPANEINLLNTLAKEPPIGIISQVVESNETAKEKPPTSGKNTIQIVVISSFIFFLIGISVNYGYRMYWNSPLHPSFMPFVFIAAASILAFTVILALDIAVGGTIEFEIVGQKFRGASGPVVLWVLTFLSIMLGLRLSGATDLAKSETKSKPPSHYLLKKYSQPNWLYKLIGSISDDSAFLEALEYGRTFRQSDKPIDDTDK